MRKIDRPDYDRAAFVARYGPWAVIAGASEGTGACFARQLAAMGINIVLVSRRAPALEALGDQLAQHHGIEYRVVTADLREEGAAGQIIAATADLDVGLYVSNAGSDGAGNSFLDNPVERSLNLLSMNAATVVRAVHGFGERFKTRGRGGFVIMSSGAGLGGQPWLVMYSATKAFELNFAESLWAELSGQDIDIIGVAAPMMDTPTLRRETEGTGFDLSNAYDPDDVVHLGLAALGREPLVIVPDGPDEWKIPQIEADRKTRLLALAEWAKGYTVGARGEA
ncbi:short-chain dehydrogenase [Sphingomonas sp. KC8]|nr:short-chain dehydrogenase [Sphingomonas sp. KC8]